MRKKILGVTFMSLAGITVALGSGAYNKTQATINAETVAVETVAVETVAAGASTEAISDVAEVEVDLKTASSEEARPTECVVEDKKEEQTTEAKKEAVAEEKKEEPVTEENELSDMAVANVDDYVNIREEADAESQAIGKLYADAVGTVLEKGEEWTKIESGSVTGYVATEFLTLDEEATKYIEDNCPKVAEVDADILYVRKEESTDSIILEAVADGDKLTVAEDADLEADWIKVEVSEDCFGYVAKEYVKVDWGYDVAISKEEEEAILEAQRKQEQMEALAAAAAATPKAATGAQTVASPQTSATGLALGQEIANYACQFVGNPYVYGGTSLTNGADCSGFTMAVYAQFGYGLPHSSAAQAGCGVAVPLGEVQPGDLICYSGHVALYIGGGSVVHASTESTGIIISSMYHQSPYTARRIVQ